VSNITKQTLRGPVARGLHVYCMIVKVSVTNESSQDHYSLCLKCELLSCVLMLKVVIMKEPSVLWYI